MNFRLSNSDKSGIYMIRCLRNEKVYIGRSSDIGGRLMAHYYILRKGTHYNSEFQKDFDLFGEDAFVCDILKLVSSEDNMLLISEEQEFINKYEKRQLYVKRNSNSGALSGTINEETRKRLSDRQMGEKNHFYGKCHSAEHIAHLKTNNPSSRPEVGAKIAEAQKGRKKMIDNNGKERRVRAEEIDLRIREGWRLIGSLALKAKTDQGNAP